MNNWRVCSSLTSQCWARRKFFFSSIYLTPQKDVKCSSSSCEHTIHNALANDRQKLCMSKFLAFSCDSCLSFFASVSFYELGRKGGKKFKEFDESEKFWEIRKCKLNFQVFKWEWFVEMLGNWVMKSRLWCWGLMQVFLRRF